MSELLSTYTFLPWLRQGIASKIKLQDNLGSGAGMIERAAVHISLQVNSQADFVASEVQLAGPGDIVGINSRAIVRTEPRHWVTDFEPNYLACIEFYDEDFPWRYTPAAAVEMDHPGHTVNDNQQTKLRPWIFLIVLRESEFVQENAITGPLPVLKLTEAANPSDIFPPADQTWAWAHVHVSKDVTGNNTNTPEQAVAALTDVLRQNPDQALSRLICPRKLEPLSDYHAFLIPAFEIGRLAGLGLPTAGQDALKAAWEEGQTEYPIYYQWYFRTGERGDFEVLVNLLEPRPVDERVGIRDMDMQDPNFNVTGMTDGPGDVPVMGLEGALKSPQAKSRPDVWPPSDPSQYPQFLTDLQEIVNLQDKLQNPPDSETGHPDPIISPPLYGRWHALQNRLEVGQNGWVNELNQDPRLRVPAGFGTKVIQANQETYMQKAWQQLGEVLHANQKIRQAQLAVAASYRVFTRHFRTLAVDQQIATTQQVHARVPASPTTVLQQVKASRLPQAAVHPAFRRLTRPAGPVMRKAVPQSNRKFTDVLVQLNDGRLTAAPPKTAPEKQISLDKSAEQLIPRWVPNWLRRLLAKKNAGLAIILLGILIVVLLFIVGFSVPSVIIALVLLGVLGYAEWLRRRVQAAERLSENELTKEAVNKIPPHPAFVITDPGQDLPGDVRRTGDHDSAEAANFRTALLDLHGRFEIELPQPAPRLALDLAHISSRLQQTLNPVYAIPKRVLSIVAIPPGFKYLRPFETIVPVMAHPVFADAMYAPLRDISSELLIPNLDLIPNNTITLLETNSKFIEAYMVGLNHEMARELLWREYPTDQRGSYFRQFWEVSEIINRDSSKDAKTIEEELRDITPLHTWGKSTVLGKHDNRVLPAGGDHGEARLVLVIKGDLLRRYPTAVIYAQKAKWVDDPEDPRTPPRKIRVLDDSDPQHNFKEPLFKAEIEPNLKFLGFNLTLAEAKGDPTPAAENPGWFFVIQERPGEPRFGLDIEETTPPPPNEWNDLAWNHLGDPNTIKIIDLDNAPVTNITTGPDAQIKWDANAADMAYILYQVPVMVAVHADEMLA